MFIPKPPTGSPRWSKCATALPPGCRAKNCQFVPAVTEGSRVQLPRSCAGPDDSCLRQARGRSSNRARSCGIGSAGLADSPLAAAPATTRGRATFFFPGLSRRAAIGRAPRALEFFQPAPSTRVRGRDAGEAIFRSSAPRRSAGEVLRSQHRAGRWDKRFLESRIPPKRDWANRRW